jgi:uncharacterized membrane protein
MYMYILMYMLCKIVTNMKYLVYLDLFYAVGSSVCRQQKQKTKNKTKKESEKQKTRDFFVSSDRLKLDVRSYTRQY